MRARILGLALTAAAFTGPLLHGQASRPHFEVASIRPCEGDAAPGRKAGTLSPGQLRLTCQTVMSLVQ